MNVSRGQGILGDHITKGASVQISPQNRKPRNDENGDRMIERIWTSAKKQEQLAKNWLYRHLDNFLEYRRSQRYSLSSIANNAFHLIRIWGVPACDGKSQAPGSSRRG